MTGLFEGVGIALESLRAHKMRAALTILGVAIGVTVVMVIGALVSGFNKGISDMLASLGPKTFWVGRYWGGQGDVDPDLHAPSARDLRDCRLSPSLREFGLDLAIGPRNCSGFTTDDRKRRSG